jgi:hypothetical protein
MTIWLTVENFVSGVAGLGGKLLATIEPQVLDANYVTLPTFIG